MSLGSNQGYRRRNLARALRALESAGSAVIRVSSLYRTEPVEGGGKRWFLNLAAEVETSLDPESLLGQIQAIERKFGRQPDQRQGPRPIDIDILLAEDLIIESDRLTVPHPRLGRRNFVLVPLAEIAGQAIHPLLKRRILDLRDACQDPAAVIRLHFPWLHPHALWKRFFPFSKRRKGGRRGR